MLRRDMRWTGTVVRAHASQERLVFQCGAFSTTRGSLTNPGTREFLAKFMQAFAAWIERNGKR
jgi:hypothetical protein